MQEQFDVVVIGGGPGGYVAAIRAAQLKMKVALIEKEHLGGICLNWGCIPTKALLKVSEMYNAIQHCDVFGLAVKDVSFDMKKVVEYSRSVSEKLQSGVASLMKKNGVTVFKGFGRLAGAGKVAIDGEKAYILSAKNIILATGARPREIPALKIDGKNIWNYKHALMPDALPKKLLVVGSGAIGVEFASFYSAMGSDVTICEVASRIMANEDDEVSALAHKCFEKRGMKVLTKTEVLGATTSSSSVEVKIRMSDGNVVKEKFDKVISAVGIVANLENIGLEKTKAKVEKGIMKVDQYLRTDEPNLYAIGDIASAPWLAHKASHEAVVAVEHIAGLKPHKINPLNIPACTYTMPQVASIGLTEAKAKEQGYSIKVGKFPLYANGKAIAINETDGFIKTVVDSKTGELLGAHMIGAEVTEMIQGLAIARTLEATEAELIHTIFPHPTVSESIHESVLDVFNRAIHI